MKTKTMNDQNWLDSHIIHILAGALMSVIGFFEPIRNVVHLVIMLSILDFIVGVFVSRKRGVAIKSKKMWRTIEKMALELIIILVAFCIDEFVGYFPIHQAIAWFICGVEFYSILESIAKISDHRVFRVVKGFMSDKIKEKTGSTLEEKK